MVVSLSRLVASVGFSTLQTSFPFNPNQFSKTFKALFSNLMSKDVIKSRSNKVVLLGLPRFPWSVLVGMPWRSRWPFCLSPRLPLARNLRGAGLSQSVCWMSDACSLYIKIWSFLYINRRSFPFIGIFRDVGAYHWMKEV